MFKNRFLLVLGGLSLLLVAMAVSRTPAKAPTSAELSWPSRPVIPDLSIQRGREADSARLAGIAEYYQNFEEGTALQLGRTVDAARWTMIAESYISPAVIADGLRWSGLAKLYTQMVYCGPLSSTHIRKYR